MRALATIQKIKSLDPIPGKDKIVYASFYSSGWKVIVDKSMNVGDLCVYVEYDSVLPQKPEFEFLRARCWNARYSGFRIRCIKLAGLFSEGIAFPLSVLTKVDSPEYLIAPRGYTFKEGKDVTALMGIVKYDPEHVEEQKEGKQYSKFLKFLFKIPLFKKIFFHKKDKGWPKWASKSDETRVQNLTYVFDKYQGLFISITEKIDGQSALYGYHKGKFYICSRNLQITKPKGKYAKEKSNYIKIAEMYDIEKKLKKAKKLYGYDFYIQGENAGPTIQGNKYRFDALHHFVFNVYNITKRCYLSPLELQNFCTELELETVPHLTRTMFNWKNIDEIVEYAKGNSIFCNIPREGVVIRSDRWLPPDIGMSNQWSLKVINSDFMLKYGL
jgi:RNA ligase (TIGR02306 family)